MDEKFDAVVIGAGFCGLGAGAALRANGVERFAILEQGARTGHFWTQTYDRIHLHSAFHDLPDDGGLRARYPLFLSREELLDYFRLYADRHALAPHFRFDTRVDRVTRAAPADDAFAWSIETPGGRLFARTLAVATAFNRVPKEPEIAGRESYRGVALHSSGYRNPLPFHGRSVLIVGSGNSAAEIALDLATGGARSVAFWVRAPRHFLPLSRMGLLFRVFRRLGVFSEKGLAASHAITWGTPEFERQIVMRDRLMRRLSVDLSRYGICKPEDGPMHETFYKGRIPTFDQGTIAQIRSGAIRVIDGNRRPIESFTEDGIRFGDGAESFDAVILATGFQPRLEEFVADADLLGPVREWKHYPLTDGRSRSVVAPALWFPGFDRTPLGGWSLGRWGWEAGEAMATQLRGVG